MTEPTKPTSSPSARWAIVAPLGASLLVAGCATGKIGHLAMTPSREPTPSALLVHVALDPALRADPAATRAADRLHDQLLQRYGKAGISAVAFHGGRPRRGEAVLHVTIQRADPGNRLKRMTIGFGAGRSFLDTEAALEVPGARQPALAFTSRANSGRRPGMILPGGIAAATGDATRFAVGGGIGVIASLRSGLGADANRSARLIVDQTRRYYRVAGWSWPEA